MNVHRVYTKTPRTPEQVAELKAAREKYQQEKATPEQLLASGGHESFIPLSALIDLHQLFVTLKQERERLGVTLAEVAASSGIDQATISKLETGRHGNPTIATVLRYSGALGKQIRCVVSDATPPATGIDKRTIGAFVAGKAATDKALLISGIKQAAHTIKAKLNASKTETLRFGAKIPKRPPVKKAKT